MNIALTPLEERALSLLGTNTSQESVAYALGVDPSRISQLLADEQFAAEVQRLCYENLQRHNKRDSKYDSLEDTLLDKLNKSVNLMVKPEMILKAIQIVNSAKRRGQDTPQSVTNTTNIVQLTLPKQISQKFTVNVENHVIKAGEQSMVTMQSGTLLDRLKATKEEKEVATIEHSPDNVNLKENNVETHHDIYETTPSPKADKTIEDFGL